MPSRDQLIATGIASVFALALGVSLTWRPAPGGAQVPTAAVEMPAASPMGEIVRHGAEPAPAVEAPTVSAMAEPTATLAPGVNYLEPIEPAQAAPAPAYAPEPSDLIPIEEQPVGWHAPLAPGQAPPTPSNLVQVRP